MSKKITRHHLKPRTRGGKGDPENIVRIPEDMHRAFHTLFDTMTLEETINFLKQLRYAGIDPIFACAMLWKSKAINKESQMFEVLTSFAFKAESMKRAYRTLFGALSVGEAITFLETWRSKRYINRPI